MSYNYLLKYRTFTELLNEVYVDFQNYRLESLIEPHQMIKVAKRVNYDLGLRIFKTKEVVLEVEKGRVKLPNDFYILNFGLLCNSYTVVEPVIQGTQVEERIITPTYKTQANNIDTCTDPVFPTCTSCNSIPCGCGTIQPSCTPTCSCNTSPCNCNLTIGPAFAKQCQPCPSTILSCNGSEYQLVQVIKSQTRHFKSLLPLKILQNAETIDCDCPNLYWNTPNTAWLRDGFLYTSFKEGKVYINYQGAMEDEEGNLLVPDHDMLNEYYEYAVKKRIIENLVMNDETVSQLKIEMVENGYKTARVNALSMVNTPNFGEMKKIWEMNRRAQYSKYYDMFKSYNLPINGAPIVNGNAYSGLNNPKMF